MVLSLPNSPLSVNSNGFLTPSVEAAFAMASFFSFQFQNSTPFHSRKRKSICSITQGGRDPKRLAIGDKVPEIFVKSFADTTAEAVMRRNFCAMKFESRIVNGGNYMIPIRIDSIGECSGCSEPNFKYREADNDGITSMVKGEIYGSLIKANESFFISESDSRKLVTFHHSLAC